MSKWVSIAVLCRINVVVELEDDEELIVAQEIALDEVVPFAAGDIDIHLCREVSGDELESARRHADEIVPLE